MEAGKILHELTYAEGLPREALKAASAQRGEMVSLFLEEIETYLALEPAGRAMPTPLFFIFHLLGEWREKAAYRPLARLLRLPGPEIDAIFGDGITSTSHRVMAAVFDGDPEPLYDIILDPNAEGFIRAGMCEALAIVTVRGELDRAVVGRFLCDASRIAASRSTLGIFYQFLLSRDNMGGKNPVISLSGYLCKNHEVVPIVNSNPHFCLIR
jgi:uncharacterized protein